VFDVAEGRPPLCRFLARPVLAEPFPRTNSTEEFWQKTAHMAVNRQLVVRVIESDTFF
jgi:hypothetical protein